jgi:hypothetical protein
MNLGVIRLMSLPLILIKLESSAASDKLCIEFSSMVCIELKTKSDERSTTRAKILAS